MGGAPALAVPAAMGTEGTTRAFATPTIVHFGSVLLFSAMLSAPWRSLTGPAVAIGACALAGVVYAVRVVTHARRQSDYVPVLEDWIWHCVLPIVGYGTLVVSAVDLRGDPSSILFVVAASLLLLLFVGIHNSWDAVTYIALRRRESMRRDG